MPVQVGVEYGLGDPGTRYGDTWLPTDFTVTLAPIIDPTMRVGVRITIRTSEAGTRCRAVEVFSMDDDGDVPARALRGFKLEDWIERACAHASQRVEAETDSVITYGLPEPGEGPAIRSDIRQARKTARARGGYTDAFLREVADVYHRGGTTPTRAVRESFGVAQSTAQLYVKRAREEGLIEPATNGKAGER